MSYCGTVDVLYLGQVQDSQYIHMTTTAAMNNFIAGTLIPKAEDLVDSYVAKRRGTLRHFNSNATPACGIALDGSGKSILFLPPQYEPWISLGSVTIDGVAVATVGDVKIHNQYLDYKDGTFTEGEQNVALFGTYGYANVPHDVQLITASICANTLLDMVRRNVAPDIFMSLAAASESGGGGLNTLFAMPTVFTPDMKRQLDAYRVYWIEMG